MIYVLTYNSLPNGDAGAVRNIAIAKIFRDCGYEVQLIGMGATETFKFCEYEGFRYTSLRVPGRDLNSRISNFFGYKSRLQSIIDRSRDDIDALVMNSLPVSAMRYIKNIARQNQAKLFIDSCEWYSPEEYKWGILDFNYGRNIYFVQRYIDKSTYPIAISKYLDNYYSSKGIRSTRIPAIMDIPAISHHKRLDPDKLAILYAGTAIGNYLKEVVEGIAMLEPEMINKIDLRIIGVTRQELADVCGADQKAIDKLGGSLRALGRVPRETVLENLQEADFTVLLRSETQRYAKAGFPTKVVESLASATPVICNITSDLGDYLRDGENSVIVSECSSPAFNTAVRKALKLTPQDKTKMCREARNTAEKAFDYRLFRHSIEELMQ